jgi:hypothetical protein
MPDEATQTEAEVQPTQPEPEPTPEPAPVGKKPSEMRAAGFRLVRGAWRRG